MSILLIVLHFVSDWMLQPRAVAKRKTTSLKWMLKHLIVIWGTFALFALITNHSQWAVVVNTILHGIIDKGIWSSFAKIRGPFDEEYLKYNKYAEDYWFYFTIAVDQIIHLIILIWLFG